MKLSGRGELLPDVEKSVALACVWAECETSACTAVTSFGELLELKCAGERFWRFPDDETYQ